MSNVHLAQIKSTAIQEIHVYALNTQLYRVNHPTENLMEIKYGRGQQRERMWVRTSARCSARTRRPCKRRCQVGRIVVRLRTQRVKSYQNVFPIWLYNNNNRENLKMQVSFLQFNSIRYYFFIFSSPHHNVCDIFFINYVNLAYLSRFQSSLVSSASFAAVVRYNTPN